MSKDHSGGNTFQFNLCGHHNLNTKIGLRQCKRRLYRLKKILRCKLNPTFKKKIYDDQAGFISGMQLV